MASNNDPAAMSRPLLQQRDATGQNPSLGTGIQQPATTTQPGMASFGSPPSPQRQQGRQQPPITMQPIRGRTFDVRLLHSSMQPTYYSLSSYHKSGPQLLSALHDVGGQIMQTLDTTSTATKVTGPVIAHSLCGDFSFGINIRYNRLASNLNEM